MYTPTLLPLTRASCAPPHTCYARSTARSLFILYPCQKYLEVCMGGMTFCVCFGMIHVCLSYSLLMEPTPRYLIG
jgi:hypothetical protein